MSLQSLPQQPHERTATDFAFLSGAYFYFTVAIHSHQRPPLPEEEGVRHPTSQDGKASLEATSGCSPTLGSPHLVFSCLFPAPTSHGAPGSPNSQLRRGQWYSLQ